MPIPEHQLQNWSSLGAQRRSQDTYTSIKSALRVGSESIGMECDVYLQGSYPNYTNIRADGDVDVVVEARNTRGTKVEWKRIRTLTKFALINYYGQGKVNDNRSGKCIKVTGSGNYLNADVVPCLRHNPRTGLMSLGSQVEGIKFWNNPGTQIVNYPKLHLKNGQEKNKDCQEYYKPTIRVFKNARNKANNNFPSYFLECMLYNVPSNIYSSSYSRSFPRILEFLNQAHRDGSLVIFRCQNQQEYIFGPEPHQINISEALVLINQLVDLWNNWT
ncbi:MAG: nucleotidyltransferase [Gammaproteobacteria bacterium]|nr:nucleotidyltransferase [Gammaproteobacteria bacterium]